MTDLLPGLPGEALRRWTPPARPLVVVSPHPDDETLLFGGLIARHAELGLPVTVVAVTDGEGGHPLRDGTDLAGLRRGEQARALEALTDGAGTLRRLGLPDGRLAAHVESIAAAVRDALDGSGPGLVAAPSPLDHHTDHLACADAVRAIGRPHTVVHGFFWAWKHTSPELLAARPLVRLDLTWLQRRRRANALAAHASQVTDHHAERLLGPAELEPLQRPYEVHEVQA